MGVLDGGRRLWVANAKTGKVALISVPRAKVLRELTLKPGLSHLALDIGRQRLALASEVGGDVWIVDTARDQIVRQFSFGGTVSDLAVDTSTGRLYAPLFDEGSVAVLDIETGHRIDTFQVGGELAAVTLDQESSLLYVAQLDRSSIAVLDAFSGQPLRDFAVDDPPAEVAALDIDTLFVMSGSARTVLSVDAETGVTQNRSKGQIDPAGMALDARRELLIVAEDPSGVEGSSDAGFVDVLDLHLRRVNRIAVGASPSAIGIDLRTGRVFVALITANRLAVIDLRSH